MSRSNEVETAMTIAAHPPPDFKYDVRWAVLNTLAAEIERLETDAKAMTIMLRGRGELLARAESAEARVAELEAKNQALVIVTRNEGWSIGTALATLSDGEGSCYSDKLPEWAARRMMELKKLEAQNARLREALEGLVSWGSMGEGDVDPRTAHRYLADFAAAEVALAETKGTK